VFIVDIGPELFVWVGKDASKREKGLAIHYAENYLKHHKRHATPVARVLEGLETSSFWKNFD